MGVHMQKILSKLPRSFANTEGSYFRSSLRLFPFRGVDRAHSFSVQVRTKDFRFLHYVACMNFRPRSYAPVVPCLKTKYGMILCRSNSSVDNESKETSKDKKSLVQARENPYAHLTVGQKVKEVGKDASYTVVIIVGIAVTGLMFFMIGRELLSSQSPSGVYGDALKKCQNSLEVAAALGEPIKGYGETTRRGRRRHVSHTEFDVNGVPHMRMRFYVEGPYKKATVHVEVQKGDSGKYEYRYLVVETEGYPHRSFVLEDAR